MRLRFFNIILLGVILPQFAGAAGFAYGTLSLPNERQGVVRIRTLDAYADYLCELAGPTCAPAPTGTPSFIPAQFEGRDFILGPDGNAGILRDSATFFRITEGVPDAGLVLPVTGRVDRAFFLDKNRRVMLFAGGKAWLADTVSGRIIYSRPFVLSGVSFLTPSPNGRLVAYYRSGTVSKPTREHTVFSLATGNSFRNPETLRYWDLLSEETRLFQFAPDSSYLIYLSDRHGVPTLYRADVTSLTRGKALGGTRLFTKGYTVSDFLMGPDGALYYIANREDPSTWGFYRYDIRRNALTNIAQNVSYSEPLKTDGSRVYFNRLAEWGSEPVQYDPTGKSVTAFPVARPDFRIASGTRISAGDASGMLFRPDGFDPSRVYPIIVWLHGGPYRHIEPGFNSLASYGTYDWMLENLRAAGAFVLKIDYRGSYGYGRKFAEDLRGGVGRRDVADVLAVLAEAKKQAKTGPAYFAGVSYGGYLGLRTLVEEPDLFAGAVSVNGVTDWEVLIDNDPNSIFRIHFGGPPGPATAALYSRASISDRAHGLAGQKILLMHSRSDNDVPYSQSVFMNEILSALGKSVEFVTYPDEEHVFRNRTTAEDVCRRLFGFVGLPEGGKCALPGPSGSRQ